MSPQALLRLKARRQALLDEQAQRQAHNTTACDARALARLPKRIARLDNQIADMAFALETATPKL